ncbi:MAG TPA: NAD(P)/FAD-dependent oxidoreductase, partial [Syntrophomonadaceae bacterium]|nr:NAD(P)/FAD-dependent oxidoreductase [Syntrophomonadaceae bacterium]
NIHLKNRIVIPAMNLGYSPDGQINERLINYYAARAQGGAGLIIIGGIAIQAQELWGGFASIHDDSLIAGHKKLVSTLKRYGTAVGIQLFHAGRYSYAFTKGHEVKAPSPLPSPLSRHTPKELTIPEIREIIISFGQAALRAKEAGYDLIEVIGSAGYLINQFYSPATNKRTDEYGGSIKNRMRFPLEVIKEIRQQVGDDMVLGIRLGGSDFVPSGNTWREMSQLAKELEKASLNIINVTGGWHESEIPQIQAEVPRGTYAYLAAKIKGAVNIPVVASNRINNPETAEDILANGEADLISVCRGFLADPDWGIKAEQGRANTIRKCIGCMVCLDMLFAHNSPSTGVACAINAQAGFENKRFISKSEKPLKILVIGAGPAGLEAARVAAIKGHEVTLVEKENRIGGQWNLAAIPPGKAEFASLLYYYENILAELRISLMLNTNADVELVKEQNPDKIILATGASVSSPPFPIAPNLNVINAWDILKGKNPQGSEIVVIGGGALGVETALHIAELGTLGADSLKFLMKHKVEDFDTLYELITRGVFKVTVVEMNKHMATDIIRAMRWTVLKNLKIMGVNTLNEAEVKEITAEGLKLVQAGEEKLLAADTIVLATGSTAQNHLYQELKPHFDQVEIVGDAVKPAHVIDAIHQAFDLANAW